MIGDYLGAMDTETQDGRAFLLSWATGPATYGALPVATFADALPILAGGKWLTFNMDYDARALMLLMTGLDLRGLHRTKRAVWRGVKVYYDPARELVVEGTSGVDGRPVKFSLFDLAQHFATSLRVAAGIAGIPVEESKGKIPASWYPVMRDKWMTGGAARERIEAYARRDALVTWRVGAWLWDQYRAAGVPDDALTRPLSAGSITARYFRADLENGGLPSWAQEGARKGYAGGRIEVFKRGRFPRVWAYDLKSAYPAILATLPDPRALRPVCLTYRPSDAVYGVERVDLSIPEIAVPPIGAPLQPYRFGNVRVRGCRIYPVGRFTAWLTIPEADAMAARGWTVRGKPRLGFYLVGERRPWTLGRKVRRMFTLRRTRPNMSYAIKILLNSLYGKLAQQTSFWRETDVVGRGCEVHKGKFYAKTDQHGSVSNVFVAAYVTALTRLRLWTDTEKHSDSVILYATDSVVTDKPLPVPTGRRLGNWSIQAAGVPAVVVGTGVYSLFYDGRWHDKVRGYHTGGEGLLACLRRGKRPVVNVTTRHAWTLGDAVAQGVPLNAILDIARALDVNFDRKRAWPCPWKRAADVLRRRQRSLPWRLLQGGKGE